MFNVQRDESMQHTAQYTLVKIVRSALSTIAELDFNIRSITFTTCEGYLPVSQLHLLPADALVQ